MSLLEKITEWKQWLWGHRDSAASIAKSTANSTYIVVTSLFDQVAALPRVAKSVVSHPPTTNVAKQVSRALLIDGMAFIVVNYSVNLFLEHMFPNSDDTDQSDAAWASTALKLSATLLANIIYIRSWSNVKSHMLIINLLQSSKLTTVRAPSTVCIDANCGALETIKGQIENNVAYFATEGLLIVTGRLLTVAEYIIPNLSFLVVIARILHNGHYISGARNAELCNKHIQRNLREHSELAFSLGLGHALVVMFANKLLEQTGIPSNYYDFMVNSAAIFLLISVSSHIAHPAPKPTTKRLPDPLLAYELSVWFLLEALVRGTEEMRRIAENTSDGRSANEFITTKQLPWKTMGNSIAAVWNSLAVILLPTYFHNIEALAKDPFVRNDWKVLQEMVVNYLTIVADSKHNWLAKKARENPRSTGEGVKLAFGVPALLTRLLLAASGNDYVQELIHLLLTTIQGATLDPIKKIHINPEILRVNGYIPKTTPSNGPPVVPTGQEEEINRRIPRKPRLTAPEASLRLPGRNSFTSEEARRGTVKLPRANDDDFVVVEPQENEEEWVALASPN